MLVLYVFPLLTAVHAISYFGGETPFYMGRTADHGFLPPPAPEIGDILPGTDLWFTQKLDHFNNADTRVWQQKYQVNNKYSQPGGPVFLLIGGESAANARWIVKGQWINWAKQFGAICFQLEHRFYGDSHPTQDKSVENLVYLSTEQALEDVAMFRHNIGLQYGLHNSTWILFGGSYAGSLSAWARLKYPHLFYAAVSTSAPLLAKVNFFEYLEVVNDALATTGPNCNKMLEQGMLELEDMLYKDNGTLVAQKLFRLCRDFNISNSNDVTSFYATVISMYKDIVQYNNDNRVSGDSPDAKNLTYRVVCDIMSDVSYGSPVYRMAEVNSRYLEVHDKKCNEVLYSSRVKYYSQVNWTVEGGGRQWMYQTCTEYGFYQTTDSPHQPFGQRVPLKYYMDQCTDIFGPQFNSSLLEAAVQANSIKFGGLGLRTSRVVFTNGSLDPWHRLGKYTAQSDHVDMPVVFINGTAHCSDMYPSWSRDTQELRDGRDKVESVLKKWIEESA